MVKNVSNRIPHHKPFDDLQLHTSQLPATWGFEPKKKTTQHKPTITSITEASQSQYAITTLTPQSQAKPNQPITQKLGARNYLKPILRYNCVERVT